MCAAAHFELLDRFASAARAWRDNRNIAASAARATRRRRRRCVAKPHSPAVGGRGMPKRRRRAPPHDDLRTRVGPHLRAVRTRRGLSQAMLGTPFYTRAMVSAVELGKVAPSLTALAHFARRLKVPLRELLPPD